MVDLMIFIKETTKRVPYSGKLSREKTFMNFMVLWLCMKVFSAKFVAMVFFIMAKASNLRTLSLRKSYFHQFAKVLFLESFPLYGIILVVVSTSTLNDAHSALIPDCPQGPHSGTNCVSSSPRL